MVTPHNPESIRNAYLGPVVHWQSSGRIMRKFSHNVAPAFVPSLLISNILAKVEHVMLRPIVTTNLMMALDTDIKDQFEMRLALLWNQALFLYMTKFNVLHFYSADAQVGKPSKRLSPEGGQYDCAHMATISALRVLNERGEIIALG